MKITPDTATLAALELLFIGQTFAYTAVVQEDGSFGIGIAIQGEAGYWPIPAHLAAADTWEDANTACEALNAARRLSAEDAMRIVTSTMAAQNHRDRTRR